MADIVDIRGADFPTLVEGSKGLILLDVWGAGCAPCVVLSKVLKEVATETDEVRILKMNFNDGTDLAVSLGVMGLPSLFLFRDGKLEKQASGLMTKPQLMEWCGL